MISLAGIEWIIDAHKKKPMNISKIEDLAWEATRLLEKGSHAENLDDPTLGRIREAHKKVQGIMDITDTTRKDYYVSLGGVVSELTTKPTEPGLYLLTWAGRTSKVRVYNHPADPNGHLCWTHIEGSGAGYPNELDTLDGETWTPILELPQTEVITWNEGMPPDGVIVLAMFRGEEGFTLARWEGDICTVVTGGEFEDVDPSTLIAWALPKGPR